MFAEITISMMLSANSPVTRGTGPEALFIEQSIQRVRRSLRASHFLGQCSRNVFDELYEVGKESSFEGWDGYNAKPVTQEAYVHTYKFLEALPLGLEMPSIGAEPDGEITLEWYRSRRRTLSISVSPTGDLHYAALIGLSRAYGTEAFFDEIPRMLIELINRVLAA
jgi:hypothetical protein